MNVILLSLMKFNIGHVIVETLQRSYTVEKGVRKLVMLRA